VNAVPEEICCIYCRVAKPLAGYRKAEHVVPQSFGRFRGNLTLNQIVCDECNGLFGRTIDMELARGSMDGLDRFRLGFQPASEFSHLGRRTPRVDRVNEGPHKGQRFTYEADEDGNLRAIPLPQLGFRIEGSEERIWYLLHELPTQAQAAEQRLSTDDVMTAGMGDEELRALHESLAARGGGTDRLREAIPGGYRARVQIETRHDMGPAFFRAIAKIGLNYVASQFGAEVAAHPAFELVRRYVVHGEKSFNGWYTAYKKPPFDMGGRLGHFVGVFWSRKDACLMTRISFHGERCYQMRLSDGPLPNGPQMQSAHFFDLNTMAVERMPG
jgi:hypothetical protein